MMPTTQTNAMDAVIEPIIQNLTKGEVLLNRLSKASYTNKTVGPYHSSVGEHLRHILDIFDCIFEGLSSGKVDLAARKRNEIVEKEIDAGLAYIQSTIHQLRAMETLAPDTGVEVRDDLGLGVVVTPYTLAGAMCQAHSHAIHHFACIGYILESLGEAKIEDRFGYNPTTPEG